MLDWVPSPVIDSSHSVVTRTPAVVDLRDSDERPGSGTIRAGESVPTGGTAALALAHDYLTQQGGAERVVLELMSAFPKALLHTALFHPDGTFPEFVEMASRVRMHPINRVAPLRRFHRASLPILAPSWSSYRIDAEVTICSSSGWAHGVNTTGRKVVYCYAPARWLYQTSVYVNRRDNPLQHTSLAMLKPMLLGWDRRKSKSADRYLVISGLVRDQVRAIYGIEAEVLPPPTAIDPTEPTEPIEGIDPGFHLCVSRLLPYKNVDRVIEAFGYFDERLVIVGEGPERDRLEATAPSNVTFAGRVNDAQLRWLYANCTANVSASYEDFGLVTVEAGLFGKPTVALRYGGFLDTIAEGSTGLMFDEPDPDQIALALNAAATTSWSSAAIVAHAERFGVDGFRHRLREIVAEEAALA